MAAARTLQAYARRATASTLLVTAVGPAALRAQPARAPTTLAPKRALSLPAVAACLRAPAPARGARRDEVAARTAATRARELALVGDRAGARAEFARAVVLDPLSPQLAYDLARASEEATDASTALSAYCQYLALAPAGADAADARARVARLTGGADAGTEQRVRDAFARGVAALDGGRYPVALAAFNDVLRTTPNAPEAVYNRGLTALALGRDADAARDLAAYVASPTAGPDRAEVLRAVDALRRPAWRPREALARGLAPGFGQFYTARPVAGVAVLAATVGAVAIGLAERTTPRETSFVDAFGNPYTSLRYERRRPYLSAGLAAGAAFALGAAVEASSFAARAQRARPVVTVQTPLVPRRASSRGAPAGGPNGSPEAEVAIGVRVRF